MLLRVTSGPQGSIIEPQLAIDFYFLITNFRQNVKMKWKKIKMKLFWAILFKVRTKEYNSLDFHS
jgi:hypothetical protein